MGSNEPTRRVKTSDTVFEIIESLHDLEGATLAELSEHLDFAKSTLHDHLSTLEAKEYIVREDGTYSLSLKFLYHGMFAKKRLRISHVGQPVIEELAEKTGEVAWITTEEHGRAVYLNKVMGKKAIQTHATIGGRGYLHQLAAGKVIMAHLSDDRINEIIDRHGLPELTPHTITEKDKLEAELDKIREAGIAINDRETVEGLRAIAVPIFEGDTIIGAIAISGPANRLTQKQCHEVIKPQLLEASNEIELKLQYPRN